jgi:DNA-binding CsgD family transcriptional regulator
VVCERGRVRVEDMGGVNGVYVGNERVERAELAPGVVVQLGRVVLRYVQAASESATTERIHRGLVLQGTLPGADTPVRDAAVLALDQLNMGVMLLGAGGQPLVVNRSARAILDAKEGLEIGSSGLRCRDASASRRLSALLDDDAPRAGAVLVPRPGRRPLTLLVTSLGPAGGVAGGSWRAVFLSDPERGIESGEEMLARLYELTPAEARITGELLQGHTVEEAAAELGVTVHTARTHLRHVFSKTDTRRQSELVLLLLNGPGQLRS